MKRFQDSLLAFVATFLAVSLAAVGIVAAQIGGRQSEVNATNVYAGALTVDASALARFHLPGSYANDSAACTATLRVGDVYFTTGSPNVVKIVASCP